MAVRRVRRIKIKKRNFAIFILTIVLTTAIITRITKVIYLSLTTKKEDTEIVERKTKEKKKKKEEKQEEKEEVKETNPFEQISYYKEIYHNRYVNYQKLHPDYSLEKIVTYVNIGLDNDFYTSTSKAKDLNQITLLVNKYNYLTEDYVPNNLESISLTYARSGMKLVSVAKEAFERMAKDAAKDKMKLVVTSSYRSYEYQVNLYNRYVKSDGKAAADTYSGRPGYSEHQTGLAIDIYDGEIDYTKFAKTNEFKWMQQNAHKYGFILRFPEGKEHITGYEYEAWHYRYVGEEIATYIHDNDITLEEYCAQFL